MPLTQSTFGNRITLSFFENLLPEGEVKESLQRAHGITGVFDFLENYGKDCAGAIVVTDKLEYTHSIDPVKAVQIDMDKVYAAIDERNSVADVIANMNPGYLSLAGAQDKFPAIYKDGTFWIPPHGAPTTHIVKAPIQHTGIKESVANEYYCMELAREIGFKVPKCLVTNGRHPLFVIERYDRFRDSKGIIHRIHQQDFCQAQGYQLLDINLPKPYYL
jgi:serine/threonine-protein kinase HipA